MISVDTNILVRVFLQDDDSQAKEAEKILKDGIKKGGVFISAFVLLEFVWVLKVNKFTQKEIYQAVMTLIQSDGITVSQYDHVASALNLFQKGKADFGDYLMQCDSHSYGARKIYTFDKNFKKEL